ncbi:hypothetical protein LguiA_030352 [Lonicera macranthoides]
MGSAKEGGSGSSIQELSLVDVPIGKVSILVLSADSSTLAATIDGDLYFCAVTNLLSQVCVLLVHKFRILSYKFWFRQGDDTKG